MLLHCSSLSILIVLIAAPEAITVSSDEGSARTKQQESMGIYKLETQQNNGQPVWGNTFGKKLFFTSASVWVVASEITSWGTGSNLRKAYGDELFNSNWGYLDSDAETSHGSSSYPIDSALTVTG